jgi:hypothetical protein
MRRQGRDSRRAEFALRKHIYDMRANSTKIATVNPKIVALGRINGIGIPGRPLTQYLLRGLARFKIEICAKRGQERCYAQLLRARVDPEICDLPETIVRHGLPAPNDEVERRAVAPTKNEADLSQSSTHSLAQRRCFPAIARTDC